MGFFNHEQGRALKAVLEAIVKEGTNPALIAVINEHELLEATNKDNFTEITKDDVWVQADSQGVEMTDEQVTNIAQTVMSQYDHSGYNEYISELIDKELEK